MGDSIIETFDGDCANWAQVSFGGSGTLGRDGEKPAWWDAVRKKVAPSQAMWFTARMESNGDCVALKVTQAGATECVVVDGEIIAERDIIVRNGDSWPTPETDAWLRSVRDGSVRDGSVRDGFVFMPTTIPPDTDVVKWASA